MNTSRNLRGRCRLGGHVHGWAAVLCLLLHAGWAAAGDDGRPGRGAMRDSAAPPVLLAQAAQRPGAAVIQSELDALIKAAKAEGEVTVYSSAPESVPQRVGAAFLAKYGIKMQLVRITTAAMIQRYFAEGEAGSLAADVVITAGSGEPFTTDGVKRGWVEPIAQAGLPVIRSGEFPERFIEGGSAVVQISPWLIAYNTNLVKRDEAPRDWSELLNPKWKGKLIVLDPRIGLVNAQFWQLMAEKYGESYLTQLAAQDLRRVSQGVAGVQGLAAGEGAINAPTLIVQLTALMGKGAPISYVTPEFTTGSQFYLVLTSRARARHPNASRLLVNYMMTPEGNKVFNDEPGVAGVYDKGSLPKQFQFPKPIAAAQIERYAKLLGF